MKKVCILKEEMLRDSKGFQEGGDKKGERDTDIKSDHIKSYHIRYQMSALVSGVH